MVRLRVLGRGWAAVLMAAALPALTACLPNIAPLPQGGGGADDSSPFGSPQSGDDDDSQIGDALLGLFNARLSGSVSGNTYLEVRNGSTPGEYLITTINGAGFRVHINSAGSITVLGINNELASASGSGNLIGQDSLVLNASVLGSATFPAREVTLQASRISGTDTSFPLAISAVASSVLVNQVFWGTIVTRDPSGGGVQSTLTGQQIFVNSTGTGMTLQLPSGEEFTAVFYEPLRAAVRVVADGGGAYATLAGSATNTAMDVVGRVDFDDLDNFTATLALQSPDSLGSQTQQLITLAAGTTPP